MLFKYPGEVSKWATAVAYRILDELDDNSAMRQDRDLLAEALTRAFISNPEALASLIGTTVIEETYFEELAPQKA